MKLYFCYVFPKTGMFVIASSRKQAKFLFVEKTHTSKKVRARRFWRPVDEVAPAILDYDSPLLDKYSLRYL